MNKTTPTMKSLFGFRMKKSPSWLGECRWVLRNPVYLSPGSQYLCCWCCALSRLSTPPPGRRKGPTTREGWLQEGMEAESSKMIQNSSIKQGEYIVTDTWLWNFGHSHGHTSSSRTTFQVLNLLYLHLQLGIKHLRLWEYSRWNHNTSYLHLQI